MPHQPKDTRLTIRLRPEERLALEVKAGDRALSSFVRELVLERATKRKSVNRVPREATQSIAQILALLGQSNALGGLDSLGSAARSGVIELDEQTAKDIASARSELASI